MSRAAVRLLVRHLAATPAAPEQSDAVLLRRFAENRDEAAFAALVGRHGPLVWGTCRRLLWDERDAEDAYQAAFLVLARGAGAVRRPDSLAAWLHGTARRVALRVRRAAGRRPEGGPLPDMPGPGPDPLQRLTARELLDALEAELARLAPAYRLPLVLCALDGLTVEQAAVRLGLTPGAVRGRLQRGRARLGRALARRGLALPAALLAAGLSRGSAVASPRLLAMAVRAATGRGTVRAAALAEGLAARAAGKLTAGVALALLAGVLAAGAGFAYRAGESQQPGAPAPAAPPDRPAARADRFGDPLPPGAAARLGTIRLRHRQLVEAVAFSPDGKFVASSGWDEAVRMWDSTTGAPARAFSNRRGEGTLAIAFSPDGTKLAAGSELGTVRLWDVNAGKVLFETAGHKDRVYAVAFAPDGRRFASAASDGSVRLWDVNGGPPLLDHPREKAHADNHALAFSPDGHSLASGFGTVIRARDVDTTAERLALRDAHGRDVVSIAFAGNGVLVSGGYRYASKTTVDGRRVSSLVGELRLWDLATGKHRELAPEGADPSGWSVAVSPDGKTLVSQSAERICLWELPAGKPLREIRGYPNYHRYQRPLGLAFSPDGKRLASLVGDHAVRLWDVASGKPLASSAEAHEGGVLAVTAVPGGLVVTGGDDGTVRVWDSRSGRHVRALKFGRQLPAAANAVAVSPDGRLLAAGGYEYSPEKPEFPGLLELWDPVTGKEICKEYFDGRIGTLALSQGGDLLAVAYGEPDSLPFRKQHNAIALWDRVTGTVKGRFTTGDHKASAMAFEAAGKSLYSFDEGGSLRVWDPAAGRPRESFPLPGLGGDGYAAFSPDGCYLATSRSFSGSVSLWESATGRAVATIRVPYRKRCQPRFSPDGRVLIVAPFNYGGTDEKLDFGFRLCEILTGREILYRGPGGSTIRAAAFAPDGGSLVTGMDDGSALVWNFTGVGRHRAARISNSSGRIWRTRTPAGGTGRCGHWRRRPGKPSPGWGAGSVRPKRPIPSGCAGSWPTWTPTNSTSARRPSRS